MKSQGVGKGDDVTIYMPMIPELPATMVRRRTAAWQQLQPRSAGLQF